MWTMLRSENKGIDIRNMQQLPTPTAHHPFPHPPHTTPSPPPRNPTTVPQLEIWPVIRGRGFKAGLLHALHARHGYNQLGVAVRRYV